MINKDDIQKIIDSTDIVSLVSEYVTLEKTGKNYRGLCPFHNEKTPSFSVNPEKKIAMCMGCKEGGSPITFLMKIRNIPFVEATAILAEKAGIKIDVSLPNKKPDINAKYYKIMENAANFYAHNLFATKTGEIALDYLHKRGIDDGTIKMFDIGLSPNKYDVLYSVLKEANVLEIDMLDLGLVNRSNQGYHDVFIKRIIFPIKDELGNTVAFSGRIYQNANDSSPKYINSSETVIFKKGHVLYNLNNAISEIRKKKRVIIYEGFMDVIASSVAGNKEAVCSMGTALTQEQARLLKKYTNNVIICYDGDKAGMNASVKAIEIFTNIGMTVHLVLLPDGQDPDEYSRKYGYEEYIKYFESHIIDYVEYLYLYALKDRNLADYSQIEEVKSQVFSSISKTNSQTLIETYLKRFSEDLNVSFASLVIDYNAYFNTRQMSNVAENWSQDKKVYESFEDKMDLMLKQQLCAIRIMNYAKESRQRAMEIDRQFDLDALEYKHRRLWMMLVDDYYEKYNEFSLKHFLQLLSAEQKNWLFNDTEAIKRLPEIPYSDEDLQRCINTLEICKIEKDIEYITSKFSSSNLEQQTVLLAQKVDLLKKRNKKIQERGRYKDGIR